MLHLIRLAGEVNVKSTPVRARFQRALCQNIGDGLRRSGVAFSLKNQWSRIFVEAADARAAAIIARVFGVGSVSVVGHTCEATLTTIVREGQRLYGEHVRDKSFAVYARRSGKHDFTSYEIEVALGAALRPGAARVDLLRPEASVYVEVRDQTAHFFTSKIKGAGGLPLGVEGRSVALLSGGFDSAVAAWQLLRRGVALDYVFCNLAGAAYERAVLRVAKVLADDWSFGANPRVHIVDFQELVAAIKENVRADFGQVVLKRLMYRAAELVASETRAMGLVTGEALGQVSSQTLANLRAIDQVAKGPVFRPLIGRDKEEIIALAQHIGTAALSAPLQEYCAIVPTRPQTAARLGAVLSQEERLDLGLIAKAVANRRIVDLRQLKTEDLVTNYLFTDEVPREAEVIDCRTRQQFDAWHYPKARHWDADDLLAHFRRLDRTRPYVLYCPIGLQSAVVAERMQEAGYEAYSFKGGTRALHDYLKEQGLL